MSDSNRLLISAAAIGVFVCALIWGVIGVGLLTRAPERAEAHYQVGPSHRSTVALAEQECAAALEQIDSQVEAGAQRGLCAQLVAAAAAQDSAAYAKAQTWIGLFGFVFVVVGLALNWIATVAATEAAQQTKRSVEAVMDTERAWLLFDDATLQDHLKPASSLVGPHPVANIVIRNVGKSVAWITRARFRIVNLKRGEFLPGVPDYREWPFDFDTRIEVLPEKTFRADTDSIIDWDKDRLEAWSWTRSRFVIYGLVEYEDAYGRQHKTQFARLWHFPRLYGTLEERDAAAHWRAVGLNPYNYQT